MAERIKLRVRLKGDVAEVKSLMVHPMESGYRRDPDTGQNVPAHHIRQVVFLLNGKPLVTGQWGGGVSTDPFFGFSFKGAKPGDTLKVSWVDNKGETAELETTIQ